MNDGILTVKADNSDLSQILHDVAGESGMSIDGSIRSVRVFGVYGPGNSRDVLTDLLSGLGYNFMMAGLTPRGAPKQLLLTPRTGAATPPSEMTSPQQRADERTYDDDHPGPGAITHLPPPPPDDPQERMEQHMQRLQQMHGQPLMNSSAPQE